MFTDTLILQLAIILDNFYMMVFSRIAQFSLLPYRSFLGYTKQFCFSLFFASRHGCFSLAYNLNSPMLNFKKSLLSFLFTPQSNHISLPWLYIFRVLESDVAFTLVLVLLFRHQTSDPWELGNELLTTRQANDFILFCLHLPSHC